MSASNDRDVRVNAGVAKGTGAAADADTFIGESGSNRRRQQTAAASTGRSDKADAFARRAKDLKAHGNSPAVIGRIIASQDNRESDYDQRQVRRWLKRNTDSPR
jgi:hypothetical protein